MTDREAMHTRFSSKNIHRTTGAIAKDLGIARKTFEEMVSRGMEEEAYIHKHGIEDDTLDKMLVGRSNRWEV